MTLAMMADEISRDLAQFLLLMLIYTVHETLCKYRWVLQFFATLYLKEKLVDMFSVVVINVMA